MLGNEEIVKKIVKIHKYKRRRRCSLVGSDREGSKKDESAPKHQQGERSSSFKTHHRLVIKDGEEVNPFRQHLSACDGDKKS